MNLILVRDLDKHEVILLPEDKKDSFYPSSTDLVKMEVMTLTARAKPNIVAEYVYSVEEEKRNKFLKMVGGAL